MALSLFAPLAGVPGRRVVQRLFAHPVFDPIPPARRISAPRPPPPREPQSLFFVTLVLLFVPRLLGIVNRAEPGPAVRRLHPVTHQRPPREAQSLFFVTLVLLFVPRLLGIVTALSRARQFGGFIRLLISALLENLISIALAPVLMIFHTFFVLLTVFGLQIKWTTQNRADTGLSISHCLSLYGWLSGLGSSGFGRPGPISARSPTG